MNQIVVTGMIISTSPIKEYDRRMVILTREQGKITAFANGARRPNSPLVAVVNPFSFGEFTLYEGRTSYTLKSAQISHYFNDLRGDLQGAYYGFYFLEIVDYFTRESNDEKEMLKLLYLTLKALSNEKISNALIRNIFELKVLAINGMAPEVFACLACGNQEGESYFCVKRGGLVCEGCLPKLTGGGRFKGGDGEFEKMSLHHSTWYGMQFIIGSKVESLYTFQLSGEVLREFAEVMRRVYLVHVDKKFNALEILNGIGE